VTVTERRMSGQISSTIDRLIQHCFSLVIFRQDFGRCE
jgi:hypothetical protein